ncbi:hypothetical protein NKH85_02510 [Mesorhizobium sp. M0924]|uniref:hypothetical protein n=1 Tax=unclassified Mesorhizobium TaxID=325217 RepID=UPI000AFBC538|nr:MULTISPECIES: hypothetical protein [unclassified Mesorhizobium]
MISRTGAERTQSRLAPEAENVGSFQSLPPGPVAAVAVEWQSNSMKNIQIIDGALNATFSVFEATEEEYAAIFPDGRDMELAEDLFERLGEDEAGRVLAPLWGRPILKRDVLGIHGTLFYNNEYRRRHIPQSKREVDWDDGSINQAQRELFSRHR